MTAYAYLRKSSVRDPSREVSHEVQEAAVRELATRHGDGEPIILSDWDKSGRLGADKRPGYAALLEAIATGRATSVYSYSLSRLGRSLPELARLIEDCEKRKIPVRLAVDNVDTTTASGRLLANVLGSVAAFEADVASERVRASNAAKLARGERLGTSWYFGEREGEDLQAVMEAFAQAGSYSAAAKLLNLRGIKPRNGKRGVWWPSSVSVIVRRMRPELVRGSSRGAKAGGSNFTLARLLRCPTCGTMLTGTRDRTDNKAHGRVRYSCRLGTALPHARISISEHLILPAIQAEANRLLTPEQVVMADEDAGKRAELEARRARIIDLYESGLIDRQDREHRLEAVNKSLERIDVRHVIRAIPRLDWSWEPRRLNPVLRALFDRIELDPATFQPIGITWNVPEWRGDVAPHDG